nr:MAG TPA: hypothetical protein [Caudoviricetes sp.]
MVWVKLEVELFGLPMCAVVCLVIKIRRDCSKFCVST